MALELKLADAIKKTGADVEARVTNEGDEPGAFLLRCFVELSDVLLAGVKEALADTRSLLEERPVMVASWREEFESLVRGHATSTLDALLARLTHASGTGQSAAAAASSPSPASASPLAPPSTRGAAPAPLLLVFARLASFMETDGVPHIAHELQSFFPTSSEVNQSLFVEEAARVMSAAAADALVRAYVDLSARRLSLMIRQSIAMCEWNGMNEPRDVRSVASFVVTDLEAVEGETRLILEDGGHGSGADDVPGGGSGIKPLTGIERGVADLFRDKDSGRVFSETVDPTQASVLGAVTKSALKSFTECVRTVPSFNRCGYQQIQVDAAYLDRHVARFASIEEDRAGVRRLIGDVVSAAGERSDDPTPLDPFIVDRILSQKAGR
jgi:hypothetical protein